jgi:hypothetical protein
MSVDSWIALAGLALVVFGAIFAGIRHALHASYKFGQQDKTAEQIREDITHLKTRADNADTNHSDVRLLKQSVDGMASKLTEVAEDVKSLMTGKTPTRRRAE